MEDGSQRVVLYYTEAGTRGGTQTLSFKMGDLTGRWARFTLTVQGSEVGGAPNRCVSDLQMSAVTWRRCGPKGRLFVTARVGAKTFLMLLVTQVRLYMDCEEYHRVAFDRSPQPLTFEAGSGIFVGNAGGTGLTRFVVSLMITSRLVVAALPALPPPRRLTLAVTCSQTWRLDRCIRNGNGRICRQLADKTRG